jgi:hypothetical protein
MSSPIEAACTFVHDIVATQSNYHFADAGINDDLLWTRPRAPSCKSSPREGHPYLDMID